MIALQDFFYIFHSPHYRVIREAFGDGTHKKKQEFLSIATCIVKISLCNSALLA